MVEVELKERPRYVSRGGYKLENALSNFQIDPKGLSCLDVGASTGGFCDCLLKAGAAHVVAVDVAYGQLDWSVREDSRVTVIERQNARDLRAEMLPCQPQLVTVDVSFISLTKVLPAVLACAAEGFQCLALVKPQFEAGRGQVGKGGVVREPQRRKQALLHVASAAQEMGHTVAGFCFSGLEGPSGNRESFILIDGSGNEIDDLDSAAEEAV